MISGLKNWSMFDWVKPALKISDGWSETFGLLIEIGLSMSSFPYIL